VYVVPFGVIVYKENGRHEGTVCLHQILLYNEEKCHGNLGNIIAFGKQAVGRTQVFVWFSKVKSSVHLLKMTSKTDENVM
jgi:hypothetical protein